MISSPRTARNGLAVAASLAVHGAVLLAVLRLVLPGPPPPEPIRLTVVGFGASAAGGSAAAAPPSARAPAAPAQAAPAAVAESKPAQVARPEPAPAQKRSQPIAHSGRESRRAVQSAPQMEAPAENAQSGTADRDANDTDSDAAVASSGGASRGSGGSGPGRGGGAGAEGAAGSLRAYCVSCPEPQYPRIARARGWQGTVDVELAIDAGGAVSAASIARSSGFEALDDAALAVARQSRFHVTDGAARVGRIAYGFRLRSTR